MSCLADIVYKNEKIKNIANVKINNMHYMSPSTGSVIKKTIRDKGTLSQSQEAAYKVEDVNLSFLCSRNGEVTKFQLWDYQKCYKPERFRSIQFRVIHDSPHNNLACLLFVGCHKYVIKTSKLCIHYHKVITNV